MNLQGSGACSDTEPSAVAPDAKVDLPYTCINTNNNLADAALMQSIFCQY
jgi:hypothetical protein